MATKRIKNKTEASASILRGLNEAIAYMRGEPNRCVVHHVHVPKKIDVKAIRKSRGLSQEQFAQRYGFSKRTLEHWEQGHRSPTGASRAFLMVIAREPEAVSRALAE